MLPIRTVPAHLLNDSAVNAGAVHQPGVKEPGMSLAQIVDGAANTILLGSVSQDLKPWGHPANVRDPALGVNRSPHGFRGPPSWNGAMFLMCDGSVKLLGSETDLRIVQALGTPSGGEQVNESDLP